MIRPWVHAARARSSAASSRLRSRLAFAIRPHSAPARKFRSRAWFGRIRTLLAELQELTLAIVDPGPAGKPG
jgi:hypothetical protein